MQGKQITRRRLLKGLGLGAAAAVLAACAQPTRPPDKAAPTAEGPGQVGATPVAESKVYKLSYWGHGYVGRQKCTELAIEDFMKEFPRSEITLDSIPFEQLDTKIATAFAAGTQPDIMSIGDWSIPGYVARDLLVELDPHPWKMGSGQELIDDFEPGTMQGMQYQGKLWGYPMEVSVISPTYRIDVMKELGVDPNTPPVDWEDWAELGKEAIRFDADGRQTRVWLGAWCPDYSPFWWMLQPEAVLFGNGASFLNEDSTAGTLNTPEGREALQFISDSIHKWKLTVPGFESPDPKGNWRTGRQVYNWDNWAGMTWNTKNLPDWQFGKEYNIQHMLKFKKTPLPINVFYTWGFVVTNASKVKADAWEFIEYMTRWPERTEIWAGEGGLFQPRKGFYNLQAVKDLPYVPFFLKEFTYSRPYRRIPKYKEITEVIDKHMQRIIATPPEPVDKVAGECDAEVNKVLQG